MLIPPSLIPYTKYTMPKNILDKAIEAVPRFGDRISLFTKKLRLAQYADSTIYSYRLKISQAVLYLEKLPDKFTQEDVDDYLSMLLERNRYGQSHFKHTVFGLKDYYKYMGLKEPSGIVMPKVRKPKRLPRVIAKENLARLLHLCGLYDKALLATIYDCALRVSEVCSLRWEDISFERQQLFVYQGKGRKDRCVPISSQLLLLLHIYRKKYPSDDFVFKTHGRGVIPQPVKPGYVRAILKNALTKACLDPAITVHALRHSAASHLLENGESILEVQKRLGHTRLTTTMIYLHVSNIEPERHVRLIDVLFPPKAG